MLTALLLYLDPQGLGAEILLAWGCHEAAHIAVLYVTGGCVKKIRLTLNGAEIQAEERKGLSYFKELLSVLAGPGCNLLLADCLAAGGERWYAAAGVQLALGVFNLLPLPGLDGLRIWRLMKNLLM